MCEVGCKGNGPAFSARTPSFMVRARKLIIAKFTEEKVTKNLETPSKFPNLQLKKKS